MLKFPFSCLLLVVTEDPENTFVTPFCSNRAIACFNSPRYSKVLRMPDWVYLTVVMRLVSLLMVLKLEGDSILCWFRIV
jgi:hypothetical protein